MKIQKATKKSLLPITIILTVLVIGGVATYFYILKNNQDKTDSRTELTSEINYDPPTQQEVEASQDAKKRNSDDSTKTNNPSTGNKRSVNVGIAFADISGDKLEIRAFTPGVIEGSGTCTASVSKDGKTITKAVQAFVDSSSSQCNPIYIPVSELESGIWKVSVKFNSPDAEGASSAMEVKIP